MSQTEFSRFEASDDDVELRWGEREGRRERGREGGREIPCRMMRPSLGSSRGERGL